ncbi:heterokaryon incompatibility protein [Diplocarpon mali]|nr:heterokaryon incompatibility protein [Diplocarpon mali]
MEEHPAATPDTRANTSDTRANTSDCPHLPPAFCSACHLLETYITTFEKMLASGSHLPAQYSRPTTARLGLRSELVARADTRTGPCRGCASIVQAFDEYLDNADDVDLSRGQCGGAERREIDYEMKLVVERQTVGYAWAAPLRITAWGLSGLHLQPTSKYPPRWEVGRVCDPEKLDYDLLKRWIACCEGSHPDTCSHTLVSTDLGPTNPVKYIDLRRSCIVALSAPPRYVALSYVWGLVPTLQTTQANLASLRLPGALATPTLGGRIPQTVLDAMTLTRALGIPYLWVDALCIVQDDLAVKQDHLRAMPFIYAHACFTLAITTGLHANAGIPGISSPRRVPASIILPSKRAPLVSRELHKRLKFLTRMGFAERPAWSRRAWTMQEQMFSPRILLMDGLASWICARTQFREEIERPVEDVAWAASHAGDQRYGLVHPRHVNLRALGKLVVEYNQRDLSFEEDVSDAFLGIAALNAKIYGGFHFGLPEAFFDLAMCWQPAPTLRPRSLPNTAGCRRIPSWSWMGWHGELDLTLWDVFQDHILEIFGDEKRLPFAGFDFHVEPLVEWQKLCLACHRQFPIANSYHSSRGLDEACEGWSRKSSPAFWPAPLPRHYFQRDAESDDDRLLYRHPVIHPLPAHGCPRPEFASTLHFRAQRLYLAVSVSGTCTRDYGRKKPHSTVAAHTLAPTGLRIGSVTLVDVPPGSRFSDCEFIAVSRGACPRRQAGGEKWGGTWVKGREHPFREDVDEDVDEDADEDVAADLGHSVTRGNGKDGRGYEFVNVLWIERRDGVAYRKGLGRIGSGAWERGLAGLGAEERWVDVVLD